MTNFSIFSTILLFTAICSQSNGKSINIFLLSLIPQSICYTIQSSLTFLVLVLTHTFGLIDLNRLLSVLCPNQLKTVFLAFLKILIFLSVTEINIQVSNALRFDLYKDSMKRHYPKPLNFGPGLYLKFSNEPRGQNILQHQKRGGLMG